MTVLDASILETYAKLYAELENAEIAGLDFDGVMGDTEKMQMQAFADLVQQKTGIALEFQDVARQMLGKPERVIIQELKDEFTMPGDVGALVDERGELYLANLKKSTLAPSPVTMHIVQHLAALKKRRPERDMFVITNGRYNIINPICEHWDIRQHFSDIWSVDRRPEGLKDKTEFLLNHAEKMGVRPQQILLVEDSALALEKAARYGIRGIYAVHDLNRPDFVPNTGIVIKTAYNIG